MKNNYVLETMCLFIIHFQGTMVLLLMVVDVNM